MGEILYLLIYQPLFNLLIFLYNVIPFPDLGLAVILLTLVIKGILFPLGMKSARSQREMQAIQPEIKELQEKYKDDKETQAKKIMELYKERNVSPFSGMIPLFVQLPILISLFQIFRRGLGSEELKHLYDFVSKPGVVNYEFLGLMDLSSPHVVIAIIAAAGQYLQMKMTMGRKKEDEGSDSGKGDMAKAMQSQMIMFLPGFTFVVLLNLPSAVGLYWIVTVIISVLQQYIIKKDKEKENGGNKENN